MEKPKKSSKTIKRKVKSVTLCYLLQRMDAMEKSLYAELGKQDTKTAEIAKTLVATTSETAKLLDGRLAKIEHEIIGVKKAMSILMWFIKLVGGLGSLIGVLWKIFQWTNKVPKVG